MRLKGGKVLLADKPLVFGNDLVYSLSDEELKAILEKGVVVTLINGSIKFNHEPCFTLFMVGDESYLRETLTDSVEYYDLTINITNKTISLITE